MLGSFENLPADEVYEGVIRRTFSSDHATVTSYAFSPRARFPLHRHPQEQITLVVTGDIQLTVADEIDELSAGQWAITGPDVEHGVLAGPDGATVFAIIVPRRESADAYTVVPSEGER